MLALAVLPVLQDNGFSTAPLTVATYAVAAAAGAMLPDFDHRHATVAQSLGPVSKGLAIGIEKVSGGHRNGTHSLVGVAVFTAVAFLVGFLSPVLAFVGVPAGRADLAGRVVTGLWLAFLFAVATTALRVKPVGNQVMWSLLCIAGGVALAVSTWLVKVPLEVIPVAVAIGAVAHLAGDMLTKEGCPLLYPWNRFRFKVANFTTDRFFERNILGPGLGMVAVVQVVMLTGLLPWTWGDLWEMASAAVGPLLS